MTFAAFVENIVWYINGFFIPLVFALAFIAFLWGVFLYLFYNQQVEKARNIILGGVITLAVMISLWGILSVLRNTLIGGGSGDYYYEPFGSTWDSFFGEAMNGTGESSEIDPNSMFNAPLPDGDFPTASENDIFPNDSFPTN